MGNYFFRVVIYKAGDVRAEKEARLKAWRQNAKEVTTEMEEHGTAGKLCRLNKLLWRDK